LAKKVRLTLFNFRPIYALEMFEKFLPSSGGSNSKYEMSIKDHVSKFFKKK